ncbi:hypothetical protein SPFM14_00051 [Salmonella phage SPFM14]|nr:hypothetical protein SPFM14_00051 [Salmonella phage SPFM14]
MHNEDIPYWIEDLERVVLPVLPHYGNLINDKPKVDAVGVPELHNEFSAPRHALSEFSHQVNDIVERLCLGLAGISQELSTASWAGQPACFFP